jgi:hypothetical protein
MSISSPSSVSILSRTIEDEGGGGTASHSSSESEAAPNPTGDAGVTRWERLLEPALREALGRDASRVTGVDDLVGRARLVPRDRFAGRAGCPKVSSSSSTSSVVETTPRSRFGFAFARPCEGLDLATGIAGERARGLDDFEGLGAGGEGTRDGILSSSTSSPSSDGALGRTSSKSSSASASANSRSSRASKSRSGTGPVGAGGKWSATGAATGTTSYQWVDGEDTRNGYARDPVVDERLRVGVALFLS